jgi:hypothetical protein
MDKGLMPLRYAARKYKLQFDWLEREARSGRLSCLIAGDAILFNERLRSQQSKWYRDRNIQAALIKAIAIILVPFISWFLNSYGNKQGASYQNNGSISIEAETKGNQSPAVVTYGPNSPVNIYLTPGQSETRSEVSETDVNRPK